MQPSSFILYHEKISEASCDAACAGDSTELCGGTWAANVYLNENYLPPALVPISGAFESRGCFTDSSKPRLLSSGHSTDYGGMTVAKCIAMAGPSYKYAAIEYHGECYWGNTLANSQTADSSCDAACAGDSTQLCGGTWVANVYENSAYQPPGTLSREIVLALIQKYEELMMTLNNDVKVWQDAIQNNARRDVKGVRSLTQVEAYEMVVRDYQAVESFVGYVGCTVFPLVDVCIQLY